MVCSKILPTEIAAHLTECSCQSETRRDINSWRHTTLSALPFSSSLPFSGEQQTGAERQETDYDEPGRGRDTEREREGERWWEKQAMSGALLQPCVWPPASTHHQANVMGTGYQMLEPLSRAFLSFYSLPHTSLRSSLSLVRITGTMSP